MARGLIENSGGAEGLAKMGITVITPVESATALKKLVDEATVATHGGKFFNYDGEGLAW